MKHPPKKEILLIFLFFFLYSFTVYAQKGTANDFNLDLKRADRLYSENPDKGIFFLKELYKLSVKKQRPIDQSRCLTTLVYFYWGSRDFNNAKNVAKQGFELAKKENIDSLCGDFLVLDGAIDQVNSKYDLAINTYKRAVLFYDRAKLPKRTGNTYVNIGVCEMRRSQFEIASQQFFKSASIFQQQSDFPNLSTSYNSIGSCFRLLGDHHKSLDYFQKSLSIRKEIQDNDLVAQSLNNIGLLYNDLKKPDSAILYLSSCLKLRKGLIDSSILALTLQNIALAFGQKNDLIKAKYYILRSLRIAEIYKMDEESARARIDYANLLFQQKEYKKAEEVLKSTDKILTKINVPELKINAYDLFYKIYLKAKTYEKAIAYRNKKDFLKDSLFTIEKSKSIADLEVKYQTVQKQKDISALNAQNFYQQKIVSKQRAFILVLIAGSVIFLVLFIFSYRNFVLKKKANLKIQTLMQELHHRVKNNLQILSSLFSMQIDSLTDEATKNALRENEMRLLSMNLVHSKLYHNNLSQTIEMKEYLSKLLQNIKNTFGMGSKRKVDLIIDIDDIKLEADKAVAIGLIVNELVTNSFKYAFDGENGVVFLSLKDQLQSKIILMISDNGKGFDHNKINLEENASFGFKLVNLMARQIKSKLTLIQENGVVYKMDIKV